MEDMVLYHFLIASSGKHGNTTLKLQLLNWKKSLRKKEGEGGEKKRVRELSDLTEGEHMVPVFQNLS